MRGSLKHKTWSSWKMGKRNWMNNLLLHMDDITMMRTWWDEKANLGLERLSNQVEQMRGHFSTTLFTMRNYFHLLTLLSLDEFLLYTMQRDYPLH